MTALVPTLETIVQAVWSNARTTTLSPACRKHQELRGRLRAAMQAYLERAQSLDANLQGDEFERSYQAAHRARAAFNRIRQRLNAHIARHGCVC